MYKQILFFWISIFIIFLWQFFLENSIFNRVFLNYSENHISNFLDLKEKILIEWRVCWEVDKRIFKTNYVICAEKIWEKNVEWKFLVSTSLYPEYNFWDNLKIFWKLQTPFENKEFSYKNFLLKEWIFWVVYYWKIEKFFNKKNNYLNFYTPKLTSFKQLELENLNNYFFLFL